MSATKSIYALLVGVNEYLAVSNLEGCLNDVENIKIYLEGRATGNKKVDVHTKVLLDEEATYDAILREFEEHLTKAGKDDIALFYFSGHGTQEEAPKGFWNIEADKHNEALTCYDSYVRGHGVWGLADKEISFWLSQIAEKEPEVVVILDCCHSGHATRDPTKMENKIRLVSVPKYMGQRPLGSYCFAKGKRSITPEELPPPAKHIAISACRDEELAIEVTREKKRQGIFSYYLNATLEAAKTPISYQDVASLVKTRIANIESQNPQSKAYGGANLDKAFLGGEILKRGSYVVTYKTDEEKWFVNAGNVHGLGVLGESSGTELALFEISISQENLNKVSEAIASAEIVNVEPHRAFLSILEGDIDKSKQYRAVITKLNTPKLEVQLRGDNKGVTLARKALNSSSDEDEPSLFLEEVKDAARYYLTAEDKKYLIKRPNEDRPLIKAIEGYTKDSADEVIGKLEHIAKWEQIIELDNPTSEIPRDAVKIVTHYKGKVKEDSALNLECTHLEDGDPTTDGFQLEIKLSDNYKGPDLYCALLEFSESFAIDTLFLNGDWLSVGKTPAKESKDQPIKLLKAEEGEPIQMYVPKHLYDLGVTERKDVYKLIVSTNEFHAELLKQGKLEEYDQPITKAVRSGVLSGTLDVFMDYTATRERKKKKPEFINDWFSKSITITTKAPKDIRDIS